MDIVTRVRELAQPLARAEGVNLVDVAFLTEYGRRILRLTIERPEAPTSVADCEAVSRAVAPLLDAGNFIPHRYALEVSSAGRDTPLWKRT